MGAYIEITYIRSVMKYLKRRKKIKEERNNGRRHKCT